MATLIQRLSLLLLFSVRLLVVEKLVSWRNDRFSVRLPVVVGCWRNDQRKAVGCHVPCGARGVSQQFTKRRVSTSELGEERDISLIWPWSWRITLSKVQRWGGQHLSKRRSKTELRNIANFWAKKYQTFSLVTESFFCAPSWSYQRRDWWTSKVMHQLRVPIWP